MAFDAVFPGVSQPGMTRRQRIDVDLDELDQIIDRSTHAPLSEAEGEKLKTALHALQKDWHGNGVRRKPRPFCRRMRRPWTSRIPASRLARDMGAMGPRRLLAPIGLPSRTPRFIPATGARRVAREESTGRKSRQCG